MCSVQIISRYVQAVESYPHQGKMRLRILGKLFKRLAWQKLSCGYSWTSAKEVINGILTWKGTSQRKVFKSIKLFSFRATHPQLHPLRHIVYFRGDGNGDLVKRDRDTPRVSFHAFRWIKFGHVDSISFIGKETIVLGYGNYIVFYDTSRPDKKEIVYRATNDVKGDGVECLCTHRSLPCFAMSEKSRNPRILINAYPSFENMKIIDALQETEYIALRFSEMEYLVALTSLPNYSLIIWNWRTSEKLYCRDTNIQVPKQVLTVSLTSPIQIAQGAPGERTLIVWELNMCYKKAVLNDLRISLPEKSRPPFSYAWGYDGDLYFSDSIGNLFSVSSDTRSCEIILSWRGDEGNCKPCLTWYKGGWVYTGPNKVQYCRRKSPEGWTRIWSITPEVSFKTLISSSVKDILYGWNEMHELVLFKGESNVECVVTKSYGCNFDFVCIIHPVGDSLVTYGKSSGTFTVWNQITASMIAKMTWDKPGIVNDVRSNPCFPYILVVQSTGRVTAINLYDHTNPMVLGEIYLTKNPIDTIRFHSSGTRFCVASMDVGEFFLIKLHGDSKMEVLATSKLDLKAVNYALVDNVSSLKLVVLPMSQLCCRSGQMILVYQVNVHRKTFQLSEDVTMPTMLTSIVPRNETQLFCIPHRSRSAYVAEINGGAMAEKFVTGHQMKSYTLKLNGDYLITFGFDGLAIVRSATDMECVTVVMPHHRMAKGIKDAVIDPYCQNIFTLGMDGTLVSFVYSGKWCNKSARNDNEALMKSPLFKQMFLVPIMAAKAKARALEKTLSSAETHKPGVFPPTKSETTAERTWLETREQERIQQDENHSRDERNKILDELLEIRKMLQELLDANLEISGPEQLPIYSFDLDKVTRRKKIEDAKAEREKEKNMQLAVVKARDKVSDYIKKLCWDSVQFKGREVQGIVFSLSVESYPLANTGEDEKAAFWKTERLKLEYHYRKGHYFEPWVPRSASMLDLHVNTKAHLSEQNVAQIVKTKFEEDELDEQSKDTEGIEKDSAHLWSGSASHNFIEVSSYHYNQFEMTSYTHGTTEISLILMLMLICADGHLTMHVITGSREFIHYFNFWKSLDDVKFILYIFRKTSHNHRGTIHNPEKSIITGDVYPMFGKDEDIKKLMMWFNKQFDEVYSIKEREIASICEKNTRFRHIINELNFFHFSPEISKTVVIDPKWSPYEQPERLMTVENDEISINPYVTQSQQELINKRKAEAERLRELLMSDDFKEKALFVMMDGVLEKLWENEIKKDVPKPKCMLEKEPENYTEDDLKAIKSYEDAVRFLQTERERYRKILEADWAKILASVRDIVNRFDERLGKLHLLKMKVDSAICQEMLKILRIRHKMQEKLEMARKEENIREDMAKNEKKIEAMQSELSKLVETLNECRNSYEALQNRDRNLDKNFKKEFPDLSPIICEQLYKLSKKRPKLLQKAALFSTLLIDLGKCTVAGTKPDHLTGECIQYLKDIEALDNSVNAPTSVNEQTWELMCKMRRAKIDCELKVRACAVDLGEAEATVSGYQKRLKNAKEYQTQLQNEIQNLKQERLNRDQNYDIQLVLKSGLVEIPLTGKISDFEECILVTRNTLTEINGIIIKAGNQKIKAMKKAANFRKGIIFKEWEHKRLRMEIEDLHNKLNTVEKIKVTKELQSILVARARGFTDEKGFLYMEEELAGVKEKFRKAQTDIYRQIDEYNLKIEKINFRNEELDSRIAELNVDVNELAMEIDKDFDEKQLNNNMKRMRKVRYRSKLVQKIQEQHNQILMLQTELELLKLRTFPTLKNKT